MYKYVRCRNCRRFGTVESHEIYCPNCSAKNIFEPAVPGFENLPFALNHWLYRDNRSLRPDHVWVNAYEVTRHYGGPEDGGWWYDWHRSIATAYVPLQDAESIKERMLKAHASVAWGNISSMAGGAELEVLIEMYAKESESREKPTYY